MISRTELSPKPLVYVVTLSWNRRDDTLQCLDSLSHMHYPNFRLLLVDNASADDTVEAVRARHPQVDVIINPENLGFSGGFNVGLRYGLERGADFILIINNDTFVAPDLLDELMAYAGASEVGILAPKIYSADEPNRIWSVGGQRNWWNLEMVGIGDGQIDCGQWAQAVDRDCLAGCAMLLKRSLLVSVGLFDESTFSPAYYEDNDLCMRARLAGLRLWLVPSARMWHKGVASSGGYDSPRQRYLMARNSTRFFKKYVRGWRWLVVLPYRLAIAIKTTLRLMLRLRFASIVAQWRGLRDGLRRPSEFR
jgi:GT2 family glycosyltransferase